MSELENAIKQQVMATEKAPSSITSEAGPVWWDDETKKPNVPLLFASLIDEHGLVKAGFRIENSAGKQQTPDALKKMIYDAIAPRMPQDAASELPRLYKAFRSAIPEKKAGRAFETFTAADLAHIEIPETPFVIERILPSGLTLLAAPPKTGKSWMCLDMADAVATGGTFWGYSTKPGAVLYLALEDNKKRLQDRLRAIGSVMPDNLHLSIKSTLCLDNGLIEDLSEWITEHPGARLIILDTLQRIKGASQRGVDAYAGDYERLSPLQELAIEKGVAIVAVHHFRKQGNNPSDDIFERIAGSTALFGVADCGWVISGKRGAEEMTFHLTGREVIEEEFKIKRNGVRWQMLGDSEQLEEQRKLDEYKTSPLVQTIRELVKESGGRWEGGATELRTEVMKRTKTVPAKTDRELKQIIIGMQEQLLTLDEIAITFRDGGRHGRGYAFERAGQPRL